MKGKKLAYYPGCPSATTAMDQDMSTKAVFEVLGVELAESGGLELLWCGGSRGPDAGLCVKCEESCYCRERGF